jgi:putative glycosyltransferase (TIGR04372 family)
VIFYIKILTHKILDLFITILLELSFLRFYLKNILPKKKVFFYVTKVNTFGDALYFYHYTKCFKKKNSLIISPEVFPSNDLLNFFFKKNEFIFYNEFIYNFLTEIHPVIKKKCEIIILKILILNLNAFNYYENYKKKYDKNIKLIKNNKFLKKYLNVRKNDPKFTSLILQIKKLNQNKFIIENLPGYSTSDQRNILKKLGLEDDNYVCLNINPYPKNHIYGYNKNFETNPRCIYFYKNYLPAIKYLISKKLKIVVIGRNDENLKKTYQNPNIIYYNDMSCQNIINDFYLVNKCLFYIGNQGGATTLPTILNKKILFLNNISFHDVLINKNTFFSPKHLFKNSSKISLQERIRSYEYFFNSPKDLNYKYKFKELSSFEILHSVSCMYNFLIKKNKKKFFYNLSNVKKYHLALYYSKAKIISLKNFS